jgi:hypothetical protein
MINKRAPYHVNATDANNNIDFVTDYGVQYIVGFDKDDTSLSFVTYQFFITNANNIKSPRDPKLRKTITAILEVFFQQNNEALLYICETGDGKQSMRSRLFEFWYNHYEGRKILMFLEASVVDADGVVNYTALLIRKDHPQLTEIVTEYTNTVKLLNDKPKE